MPNRQRQAREKLELYLVHLLMAYRRLIFIVGLFIFAYSIAIFFFNSVVAFASLVPALYLLLLSNSYSVTLYSARLGAWIGTLWRHEG
jgi:hypothetical protein